MIDALRRKLYFTKKIILWCKGEKQKRIVPFDEDVYEKMSHTYFGCLPVSMNIKYLQPITSLGKCFDRSLMMFCCFDDALLVCADVKELELTGGKDAAGHYWIEIGDYVYDPSLIRRIDKDLYYEMYQPINVIKNTKEEYCMEESKRESFDDITKTTISDYQPGGKKRYELMANIPLVVGIAGMTVNIEFMAELKEWLKLVQYDEKDVDEQLTAEIMKYSKNNRASNRK